MSYLTKSFLLTFLLVAVIASAFGQTENVVPASLYQSLQWRCIGPHRGGRALDRKSVV